MVDEGKNHEGFSEISNGFTYDVDRIDDELGMIEHNGIVLIHDRLRGVLRIERKQLTLPEIVEELEELL